MRKRSVVLLVAVSVALSLGPVAPAQAHHRTGPCNSHRANGETIQRFMKHQIRCAVATFGPVPGGSARATCIAKRESGLIPTAQSPTGEYLGLFQHSAASWPKRFTTWTRSTWELSDSALSGRSNAIVTIRMVQASSGWKAAGWPVFDC